MFSLVDVLIAATMNYTFNIAILGYLWKIVVIFTNGP